MYQDRDSDHRPGDHLWGEASRCLRCSSTVLLGAREIIVRERAPVRVSGIARRGDAEPVDVRRRLLAVERLWFPLMELP